MCLCLLLHVCVDVYIYHIGRYYMFIYGGMYLYECLYVCVFMYVYVYVSTYICMCIFRLQYNTCMKPNSLFNVSTRLMVALTHLI